MVGFETLELSIHGPVGRIVLDRPDAMNALSPRMLHELLRSLGDLESRDDVRVVVLEGKGPAFSVGFDLQAMGSLMMSGGLPGESEVRELAELGEAVVSALVRCEKITVASVHGYAIGGGFLLMTACDVRLVSRNTKFSIPEVDIGIPLLWGGVPLLVRELGPGLARDLVMSCRRFGADTLEALNAGFRIVDESERVGACESLVEELGAKPPLAMRITKKQFLQACGLLQTGDHQKDADHCVSAMLHPDFLSTAMAYLQRLGGK